MAVLVAPLALATTLAVALGWRHRLAPPLGAAAGVVILAMGGLLSTGDVETAGRVLWRPLVTITAIMTMTSCAHALGLLDRLAGVIEPRTRGPVRHAFAVVFALSALTAAALSNDAAILVLTPTVIALLRQVYPRRHAHFAVPFAFAVFYAAGVAPLATSNPMNLVVADHAGISFNAYAVRMIPVALVGWVVAYLVLSRVFRTELADESPALGDWPERLPPIPGPGWVVVAALIAVLCAYPVVSFLDGPLWVVAAVGALVCLVATRACRVGFGAVAGGVSWEILPFLCGVLLIATGLQHAGLVDHMADFYRDSVAPLPTVAVVAALGSALLNNHPMALLGALAIEQADLGHSAILAALVGGDLGPRLLPMGSLAGLLWLAQLRRQQVAIPLGQFVKVGIVVTVPSLLASLLALWLVMLL